MNREELLNEVKKAKSIDNLMEIAQENGIALTDEQAAECYASLHTETGAISDEELKHVFGGLGETREDRYCENYGGKELYWR